MPEIIKSDICYLCAETAQIQNLGASFLVDCSHCGNYEIEALAATIELQGPDAFQAYLEKERKAGKVRPVISRALLKI